MRKFKADPKTDSFDSEQIGNVELSPVRHVGAELGSQCGSGRFYFCRETWKALCALPGAVTATTISQKMTHTQDPQKVLLQLVLRSAWSFLTLKTTLQRRTGTLFTFKAFCDALNGIGVTIPRTCISQRLSASHKPPTEKTMFWRVFRGIPVVVEDEAPRSYQLLIATNDVDELVFSVAEDPDSKRTVDSFMNALAELTPAEGQSIVFTGRRALSTNALYLAGLWTEAHHGKVEIVNLVHEVPTLSDAPKSALFEAMERSRQTAGVLFSTFLTGEDDNEPAFDPLALAAGKPGAASLDVLTICAERLGLRSIPQAWINAM